MIQVTLSVVDADETCFCFFHSPSILRQVIVSREQKKHATKLPVTGRFTTQGARCSPSHSGIERNPTGVQVSLAK